MANNNPPKRTGKGLMQPNVFSPASTASSGSCRNGRLESVRPTVGRGGLVKEDANTPVKELISLNITPRSSSRKARVDSASSTPKTTPKVTPQSTPNGTPSHARPTSMVEGRDWPPGIRIVNSLGTKDGNSSRTVRAQSEVSRAEGLSFARPISTEGNDFGPRSTSPETLPKFFHADDARPRIPQTQQRPPKLSPKLQGYPCAHDGNSVRSESPLPSTPDPEEERPKFFYANKTRESKSPSPGLGNGALAARPPLHTIFSSYQVSNPSRPPSPLKEEIVPVSRQPSLSKPSPRRHTRLVSSEHKDIRIPEGLSSSPTARSRRSSLAASGNHASQTTSPTAAKFNGNRRWSLTTSDVSISQSPTQPHELVNTAPSHTEPTEPSSTQQTQPQSPGDQPSGQSKLDHLNKLAANARRERKVLDLEISNSSLLAINRTLEAEMRKQKAELRHLRRLRSSGRLSSIRSLSTRFSALSHTDELSALDSSEEEDLGDEDGFSNISNTSDDTSFPDSSTLSPPSRSSMIPLPTKDFLRMRRQRAFKLDLAAQKTLLLDSQKLNQALKRCLGRTDELIVDGRKALEYRVNVADIEALGPRVVMPDLWDEEVDLRKGLLSPGIKEQVENPWEGIRRTGETLEDSNYAPDQRDVVRIFDPQEQGEVVETLEFEAGEAGLLPSEHSTSEQEKVAERSDSAVEGKEMLPSVPNPSELGPTTENLNTAAEEVGTPLLDHAADEQEHSAIHKDIETAETRAHLIEYVDPGIDTGSATPATEEDEKGEGEEEKHNEPAIPSTPSSPSQSSGSSETESHNEPKAQLIGIGVGGNRNSVLGSPSKGLEGFWRIVGGNWST
ncbi:MAG: hypothetical protein LQ342_007175 [Letrouitia transgressa]|nr:MAG: hypothetical protein LQ342_007175 [Letrouitia transgressa]